MQAVRLPQATRVVAISEFDYIPRMHRFRKSTHFARWLLALTLVLSPVLSVWQGGVAAAAPVASVHEHHSTMPSGDHGMQHTAMPAAQSAPDRCQGSQHDACHGSCCAGCGHCAGVFDLGVSIAVPAQPVRTPRVTRLLSSSVPSLRERPPRALSV